MNKVERLEWVAKTFGADFVLPYRVCRDWQEILSAIKSFKSRGETWGMRTDFVSWNNGRPFNLQPFIQKGTKAGALKIWQAHKRGLLYIVCRNILEYRVNAVAWPLYQEYIQFEFNKIVWALSGRCLIILPNLIILSSGL